MANTIPNPLAATVLNPRPARNGATRARARAHRPPRRTPLANGWKLGGTIPIIVASILISAFAAPPAPGSRTAAADLPAASDSQIKFHQATDSAQPVASAQPDSSARALPPGMEDHDLAIADLGISVSLVAIPGGTVRLPQTPSGASGSNTPAAPSPPPPAGTSSPSEPAASNRSGNASPTDVAVNPFYITSTEITWELFDVYIYSLDQDDPTKPNDADVVTRPSKPYLPPDRGFGHAGYPAISMSYKSAREFCVWLSHKTGRKFRLPTVAEWTLAAAAGAPADTPLPFDAAALGDHAWYSVNSPDSTQAVAGKLPNSWGLYDTLGNVAEWVDDGTPEGVALGGSYLDPAEKVSLHTRQKKLPAWQAADAQIPKSTWWLSNCTWVGFRVVCENEAK